MDKIPDIERPSREFLQELQEVCSAGAAGALYGQGIRQPQITGPLCLTPDAHVVGPALTLQYMPKREDLHATGDVVAKKRLSRQVLVKTQPGDVVVVDARGNMTSGVFGEMLLTYFKARGGAGIVVDGCIRDSAGAKQLGIGIWARGVTPNRQTQTDIFPYAVNVPVACGGVLVMPGDIIIADGDGIVVCPIALARAILERTTKKHEWEAFTRLRLSQGGELIKYYPLSDEARVEYEAWRAVQEAEGVVDAD